MFSTAPISGLVLAGGLSSRMGEDKALIQYHDKPQYQHVFELLDALLPSVFISCRQEQAQQFDALPCIVDQHADIGPMAALLAAFKYNPNTAWLVLGCDYPNLGTEAIEQLIAARDSEKMATAFWNSEKKWPEPLLAIWEPKALASIQVGFAAGIFSLKRVLEQSSSNWVEPANQASILSVDTAAQRDQKFSSK